MFIYFFNFILILYGRILDSNIKYKKISNFYWSTLIVYLTFFMGLRFEVGGDWYQYIDYFNAIKILPTFSFKVGLQEDPGYLFLAKLAILFNFNIIATNIVSAFIFIYSLKFFCENQKDKYLSLFISYPYFIILVGMGYSRQALAAGLLLVAIIFFIKSKLKSFLFTVLLAILFHKTAVISLFLLLIYPKKISFKRLFFFILITFFILLFLYQYVYYESTNRLIFYFLGEGIHFISSGAIVRIALTLFAVLLIIFFNKKMFERERERRIYIFLSFFTILLFPMTFFYSSFVDRVGVYLVCLQIVAIPAYFSISKINLINFILFIIILFTYICLFFLWTIHSTNSFAWIPYNFSFDIFQEFRHIESDLK